MKLRVFAGSDRPAIDQPVPAGTAVPRAGESVALRDPATGSVRRWSVRTVEWDYSADETTVTVHVTLTTSARVPSFAAYTD